MSSSTYSTELEEMMCKGGLFPRVDKEESYSGVGQLRGCRHVAHCMLHAPWDLVTADGCNTKAAVLMQLRSDGYLGFPGGVQDNTDGDAVTAVNRELCEEMGLDPGQVDIQEGLHYRFSHLIQNRNIVAHFYAVKVPLEQIQKIERQVYEAKHFGKEVLSAVRVPVFSVKGGDAGLPVFLRNSFIGNARMQLVLGLVVEGIISAQEAKEALERASLVNCMGKKLFVGSGLRNG